MKLAIDCNMFSPIKIKIQHVFPLLENSSKSFQNLKAPKSKAKGIDRDHVDIPTNRNTHIHSNRYCKSVKNNNMLKKIAN